MTKQELIAELTLENKLSFPDVMVIANHKLHEIQGISGHSLYILDHAIMESDYAWIFHYQNKRYLETGDHFDLLAGNAPLFVSKRSGKIHLFSTAHSTETMIDLYENEFIRAQIIVEHLSAMPANELLRFNKVANLPLPTLYHFRQKGQSWMKSGCIDNILSLKEKLGSLGIESMVSGYRLD